MVFLRELLRRIDGNGTRLGKAFRIQSENLQRERDDLTTPILEVECSIVKFIEV